MLGAEEPNQERGNFSEYTIKNDEGFLKKSYCVCHWISKEANADMTKRTHSLKPYAKFLFGGMIVKIHKTKIVLTSFYSTALSQE